MYGSSIDDTANTTDSTIKARIDAWYKVNMTSYTSQLEDTVFCNDRSYTVSDSNLFYGAITRLVTNKMPILKCQNTKDKFTVEVSNGNGNLTYPVGLITVDEMAYAGGVYGTSSTNNSFYLYNGDYQWSLSMSYSNDSYVFGFTLDSPGNIANLTVRTNRGVRPVLALKAGTAIMGGLGTATNPFIVG